MSLLRQQGIQEVANVYFYTLTEDNKIGSPFLFSDTLKFSNIEETCDRVENYGGKGNSLISAWDYNRNIEIHLQDALFSMKSLAYLFGGKLHNNTEQIIKTEEFVATATSIPVNGNSSSGWSNQFFDLNGKGHKKLNPKFFNEDNKEVTSFEIGKTYFCTYFLNIKGITIDITESKFPDYCCLIGETVVRDEITGIDKTAYFAVPKAKLKSNFTIDLTHDASAVFDLTFFALALKNLELVELIIPVSTTQEEFTAELGKAILGKMILGK